MTGGPGTLPLPPAALTPLDAPDCQSVLLLLPARRSGCRPDDYLTLELRAPATSQAAPSVPSKGRGHASVADEADGWIQIAELSSASGGSSSPVQIPIEVRFDPEGSNGRTVLIRKLEPYSAYEFRARAFNLLGSSAGRSTGPLLTDAIISNLARPPRVVATSSAGFAAEWVGQTSHCRPQVALGLPPPPGFAPTHTTHSRHPHPHCPPLTHPAWNGC